jgi:hypothetical protein
VVEANLVTMTVVHEFPNDPAFIKILPSVPQIECGADTLSRFWDLILTISDHVDAAIATTIPYKFAVFNSTKIFIVCFFLFLELLLRLS